MPAPDFLLRDATADDLPDIAAIHLQAYSKRHFTSRLPAAVLVEYYRLFLSGGAETLVLSDMSGVGAKVIGFAVFGRGVGNKIAQFKRENRLAIINASVVYPVAAGKKVLRQIWTKLTHGKPGSSAEYLLLSVAVARPGTGAGGLLLDAFLERARRSGTESAGLYVNADNIGALNAYVAKGFLFRELHGNQFYMERAV